MSDDEAVAAVVCVLISILALGRFAFDTVEINAGRQVSGVSAPIVLTVVGTLLFTFLVLRGLGSHDVRDNGAYLAFYFVMALAWLKVCERLAAFFGLSYRDDCLERGNRAAAVALAGAIAGGGCCFAGANVGEGPGFQVVVFCGALATGGMFVCWTLLNLLAPVADAITMDRDMAAGIRTAGFFVAEGLVLGRAVAGDWHSGGNALLDFFCYGWPALVLVGLAAGTERLCEFSPAVRPRANPRKEASAAAAALLAAAAVDLVILGFPR